MAHLRDHLQKVRAFGVVVQLGSFRKAAARLRISQPALSQSVQVLESVLGKRLLVRTSRGVVPTEEGIVLRGFAEKLSLELDALDQKLVSASEPMSGHVRIGSFESLTIALFPGFIVHALARFPKLTISVTSGTSDELPEMLLDRRIHLAVSTAPREHRRSVVEPLFSEHYRFYVEGEPERDRRGKALDKRALGRLPFIVVPEARDDAGRTIPDYLTLAAARRRATISLSTFEAVKSFTMHGIGIGVLPTLVARADVLAGRLRELDIADAPKEGFGEHRIVAHLHTRDRSDLRLARLVDELKRYATPRHVEGLLPRLV
jgi:DNA-binding transcriptional LysR family regulator